MFFFLLLPHNPSLWKNSILITVREQNGEKNTKRRKSFQKLFCIELIIACFAMYWNIQSTILPFPYTYSYTYRTTGINFSIQIPFCFTDFSLDGYLVVNPYIKYNVYAYCVYIWVNFYEDYIWFKKYFFTSPFVFTYKHMLRILQNLLYLIYLQFNYQRYNCN